MATETDSHYLTRVAELGDRREVVSTCAIHGENDIKLVEKGTRIDSTLLEKLLRHKLLRPIDECVSVEGAVTTSDLAGLLEQCLEANAALAAVKNAFGSSHALGGLAARAALETPLAFKLTLARELNPAHFEHAIETALVAAALARASGMPDDDVVAALEAGYFHDIGELHLDPAVLGLTRSLTEAERRHICSHPVIAHLVLREFPRYRAAVGTAVLQHHERLDGSGYPKGLRGDRISPLGHVLMVSEVAATLLRRGEGDPRAHIRMVLGLNRRKFSAELLAIATRWLGGEIGPDTVGSAEPQDVAALEGAFARISAILGDWKEIHGDRAATGAPSDAFAELVDGRVAALSHALVQTGFDWRVPEQFMSSLGSGPEARYEMAVLARETQWQLREILLEARRSRDGIPCTSPGIRAAVSGWIEKACASMAAAQAAAPAPAAD